MTNAAESGRGPMAVALHLDRGEAAPGETVTATVTITNTGTATVTANSRLALGYRDGIDRDLYCEILDADGKEYTGYDAYRVDSRPKELGARFFKTLAPGESLRRTFDLQEWYRITREGRFQVRVVYDPKSHPEFPTAASGPAPSPWVTLVARAGNAAPAR